MTATLLVSACAGCSKSAADKGAGGPTATVATEPPRTTTTNPYAVPAVIDAAYVNRVLAGLEAQVGEVTRQLVKARGFTDEIGNRLQAVYAKPDVLQLVLDSIQNTVKNNFAGYKPDPGDRKTVVSQLITAHNTCIFASVHRDYSPVVQNPLPDLSAQWIGLVPLDHTRDPKGYNFTSWAIIYEGFPRDHSQPPDPCGK